MALTQSEAVQRNGRTIPSPSTTRISTLSLNLLLIFCRQCMLESSEIWSVKQRSRLSDSSISMFSRRSKRSISRCRMSRIRARADEGGSLLCEHQHYFYRVTTVFVGIMAMSSLSLYSHSEDRNSTDDAKNINRWYADGRVASLAQGNSGQATKLSLVQDMRLDMHKPTIEATNKMSGTSIFYSGSHKNSLPAHMR